MNNECNLCPRKCKVNRENGEIGFCGAESMIKIARADLHFGEEPCISGKNGSGTVFFSGCNMKCIFCQNYEISTLNKGYNVSVEGLADIFIKLKNKGAHNINLVTGTHYTDKIIQALDIAKSNGLDIPKVYNSGGYESVETIKQLSGYIDVYMPDMKYFDDKYAVKFSSASNYFDIAKAAISEMYKQVGKPVFDEYGIMKKGIIVRHLMLPGLLFDSKKIIDYLYETYKDNIYISIMSQYTPTENTCKVEKLNRLLNPKHYETMIDYCEYKGIRNAYIQGVESTGKEFIPEFYDEEK